jgi:hypothetical protein
MDRDPVFEVAGIADTPWVMAGLDGSPGPFDVLVEDFVIAHLDMLNALADGHVDDVREGMLADSMAGTRLLDVGVNPKLIVREIVRQATRRALAAHGGGSDR